MTPETLKEHALYYASLGWHVFRLAPNSKIPLKNSNGFKDATTDIDTINRWWDENPNANIGVATGFKSNLAVIDIDPRHGGDEAFDDLEDVYGKLEYTVESYTGGGGRQLFFQMPKKGLASSAGKIGRGIDIKANGGYVVAPPSIHPSGKAYEWEVTSTPENACLIEFPETILAILSDQPEKSKQATTTRSQDWIACALNGLEAGNRNDTFCKIIGKLHKDKWLPDNIYSLLAPHANKANFSETELRKEIEGICKRYQNKTAETPESPESWDEPIPFKHVNHPASLSHETMPPQLYEICEHIVKVMKVPIELPYNYAMPVISTAIGSLVEIVLPTHIEPAPYWGITIQESGSRKSPTFSTILKPILVAERNLQKEWEEEYQEWKYKKDLAETKLKLIKSPRKKSEEILSFDEMKEAYQIIDEEPIRPHLWTQDTTPQSLAKLICENKSMSVFSAEGGSIIDSFGQYSKSIGADVGVWLSGHAGDPAKYTRATGPHYSTDKALLSVGISLQSEAFNSLTKIEVLMRRGFLARFAIFCPPDPRGQQFYELKNSLNDNILEQWDSIVANILELKTKNKNTNNSETIKIYLANEAWDLFITFGNEIQRRIAENGDLRPMADWASKLPGLVSRISLIYHFFEKKPLDYAVSKKTFLQAINAGRKMIEHYKCAFKLMGTDVRVTKALMFLNKIKERGETTVKTSIATKNGWGSCVNVKEVRSILWFLTEHGYLKPNKEEKPTTFHVNPYVLSGNSGNSEKELDHD